MSIATRNPIEVGAKDFLTGLNSSTHADDGFFSTGLSRAVNLNAIPGAVYPQQPVTDLSVASSGNFIAMCKGGGSSTGLGYMNNYGVTDTGKFFHYNGTSFTLGATDGAKSYTLNKSDIIFYKENLYCTSATDIAKLTLVTYAITGVTNNWWTGTLGKASLTNIFSHFMLVFEDNLWISDGPYLHKWDGTTGTAQAFTMTDDQNITALGIDAGSGRMLIGSTQGANASDSIPRINKISLWDGYSNKVLRSVIVDDMVTGIYPVGGTTFITYGYNIGYWNGSGITFLRTLTRTRTINGSTYSSFLLPYKVKVASVGSCLYVSDYDTILAFEAVQGGSAKIWYYAYSDSQIDAGNSIVMCDGGQDQLLLAYPISSTPKLYRLGMRSVGKGSGTAGNWGIISKFYRLPKPIKPTRCRIFFDQALEVNKNPCRLYLGNPATTSAVTFEAKSNTNTGQYWLECNTSFGSMEYVHEFYFYIVSGNDSYSAGITRIQLFYEDYE